MGSYKSTLGRRQDEFEIAKNLFSEDELEKWKICFYQINGSLATTKHEVGFHQKQLLDYTKEILTPTLQKNIMKAFVGVHYAMLSSTHDPDHYHRNYHHKHQDVSDDDAISLETFLIGVSYFLKAGIDEKTRVFSILCGSLSLDGFVKKEQMIETLKNLFQSYILAESKTSEFKTWNFNSQSSPDELNIALISYFLNDIKFDDENRVIEDVLVRWMGTHTALARMIDLIVYSAFHFEVNRNQLETDYFPFTIPSCDNLDWTHIHTLLTIPTLLILNYQIPSDYRCQWKLVYSMEMYGESFSTLIKRIANVGPTIMIIQDEDGYIFGGFNSKNWEISSKFLGDDSCFLFSLHPKIAIYTSSGYDKNYCYLNMHQDTLANGLGFGGHEINSDYFALWLDSDFGKGRSQGPSTIFNSPRLSAKEYFKIRAIEIWAVDPLLNGKAQGKAARSILDVDPEVQAILELTGKTRKSDGLREPTPVDDD